MKEAGSTDDFRDDPPPNQSVESKSEGVSGPRTVIDTVGAGETDIGLHVSALTRASEETTPSEKNLRGRTDGTLRSSSEQGLRVALKAKPAEIEESVSEKTNVTTRDVARIFRATVTTTEVTAEEVARVKRMHDKISEGARFSFDYCALLLIAIVIAAMGLVSDSGTTVISSMLISPIMGPVVGMAYGASVCDYKLVWRSLRTECVSLLLCVFLGAFIALCTGWTKLAEDWATAQMYSRGTVQNLLVGLPVAFSSGLGVALAVLDDQTSSLVGVAISASLLPPAVNTGLLWVYAAMLKTGKLDERQQEENDNFVRMGLISFSLTVSNIILVILSSMLMFRIKEVLPIKKKIFWHDLKTARRIYQKRALVPQTTGLTRDDAGLETIDEEAENSLKIGPTRSNSFGES